MHKFFKWFKTNKELSEENFFLQDQVEELVEQLNDQIAATKEPYIALDYVIQGGVEWYDYDELKPPELKSYQAHAEQLLRNPVFKNEINFLVNNNAKKALLDPTDYPQLRDIRVATLALSALKQRIEEIPKPKEEDKPADDPHEGI